MVSIFIILKIKFAKGCMNETLLEWVRIFSRVEGKTVPQVNAINCTTWTCQRSTWEKHFLLIFLLIILWISMNFSSIFIILMSKAHYSDRYWFLLWHSREGMQSCKAWQAGSKLSQVEQTPSYGFPFCVQGILTSSNRD